MGASLFGGAIVAWSVGIAGFIVWYVDNGLANAASTLAGASQLQNDAYIALAFGIIGVVIGLILTIMAFQDP